MGVVRALREVFETSPGQLAAQARAAWRDIREVAGYLARLR